MRTDLTFRFKNNNKRMKPPLYNMGDLSKNKQTDKQTDKNENTL